MNHIKCNAKVDCNESKKLVSATQILLGKSSSGSLTRVQVGREILALLIKGTRFSQLWSGSGRRVVVVGLPMGWGEEDKGSGDRDGQSSNCDA